MIKAEDWTPAEQLVLEPNALRAAKEQIRSLALTAEPGAGKTEMLAQRADFLLRTGTCHYPKRILAISFKTDASKNLKERVRRRCGGELSARFDSFTFHAFAKRILDRFRTVLTGNEALDADYKIGDRRIGKKQIEFSDLIHFAILILQTSKIARNAVRKTYSDVFLDEFQDCTTKQYELIKIAFQDTPIRLTAVGDTKQKIMGWAGALEGIFRSFAADFNAVPLNMYMNFRSQPRLLSVQNEIIRKLDPASVMPPEQIVGDAGIVHLWDFLTSASEAEYLSEQILIWITEEGIAPSEIAILVSKQLDLYADLLMTELGKRNIPFRNEHALQDLSAEPATRLIIDYLASLYNIRSPAAWIRLMEQLIPFGDDDEQEALRQDWQSFIKAERSKALLDLLKGDCPDRWNLLSNFLRKIGLANLINLSPDYESTSRLREVIQQTKSVIDECMRIEQDISKALTKFSDDQAVRILTIHKSKGLEFDSVIILAVEEETFWGDQAENRCAFFVAVSRAKRRLILTSASTRPRPQGHTKKWDVNRNPQMEYLGYAIPFDSDTE